MVFSEPHSVALFLFPTNQVMIVPVHNRKEQWSSCAGLSGCLVVNNTQLLLAHQGMFIPGEDRKKEGTCAAKKHLYRIKCSYIYDNESLPNVKSLSCTCLQHQH